MKKLIWALSFILLAVPALAQVGQPGVSGGTTSINVVGNVTGNLTGNVTGNVTGNLTGNVTGHLKDTTFVTPVNAVLSTGGVLAYVNATNPTATKIVTIPTGSGNAVYTFVTSIVSTGGLLAYVNGTIPTATKTVTIPNGSGANVVYTFVAVVAVAGDVKIGADADATMLNLSRCINKNGGTEGAGQDYMSAGGVSHPLVSVVHDGGANTETFTTLLKGARGNVTISTTEASITPTSPTGGVGVAVAGDVAIGTDADTTMLNFSRAVNKSGGTEGVDGDYMSFGGAAHPLVSDVHSAAADTETFTVLTRGVIGNITITTSEASITPTSPSGGVNGTVCALGDVRFDTTNTYLCTAAGTSTGQTWKTIPLVGTATTGIFDGAFAPLGNVSPSGDVVLGAAKPLRWGTDVYLYDDAAGILALRNSTTAQAFKIYNTFTDAANYERGGLGWTANALVLGTAALGTGTSRDLSVSPASGIVNVSANLVPVATDARTAGTSSALWSDVYVSRTVEGSKSFTLTDAAGAATVWSCAIPTSNYLAGEILWAAKSTDATDYRVTDGRIRFAGVNKAGATTCTISVAVTADLTASSNASTLVCTWTNVSSTTNCLLKVTCTDNTAGTQTMTMNSRLDMPIPQVCTPQ
jgi:hypothetical protein